MTGATLDNLLNVLHDAERAATTGEMGYRAAEAQALAVGLAHYLDRMLDGSEPLPAGVGRDHLHRARFKIGEAIVRAEAVGMATDLPSMTGRVAEFQHRFEEALPLLLQVFGLADR